MIKHLVTNNQNKKEREEESVTLRKSPYKKRKLKQHVCSKFLELVSLPVRRKLYFHMYEISIWLNKSIKLLQLNSNIVLAGTTVQHIFTGGTYCETSCTWLQRDSMFPTAFWYQKL
jgi:hypothetical protein